MGENQADAAEPGGSGKGGLEGEFDMVRRVGLRLRIREYHSRNRCVLEIWIIISSLNFDRVSNASALFSDWQS